MNVLDELRDRLYGHLTGAGWLAEKYLTEDLRAFEAAHPGLKDFTVMCCNCGCLFDDDDAWWAPELFMGEKEAEQVFGCQGDGLDGWSGVHLCPVCAKEATS